VTAVGRDNSADALVAAWGSWGPTLTHDARRVAYVSDRRGTSELWVEAVDGSETPAVLELSDDPVLAVRWSPDGRWLACSVATGGGVRSEVWVVRPDGSGQRRLAGDPAHAVLGPWSRRGHRLVVTIRGGGDERPDRCVLIDPDSGQEELITSGGLAEVLDLSDDRRFALYRDGTRGAQVCRLLDRRSGSSHEVLPHPGTGSTDLGLLRPPPDGDAAAMVAYLVTDAGQPRRALVAVPLGEDGARAEAGARARRDDAELEFADADAAGGRVLLAWNVEGRSELELLDTASGHLRRFSDLPGAVVSGGVVARDGNSAVLAIEGPLSPRRLWELELDSGRWRPITPSVVTPHGLVTPTLERLDSHDGLPITGWLYRPAVAAPGRPAVVSVHGGPESQERPVFHPEHQVLAAAGTVVFAPNIRGSSGFGRAFVHADDRFGRLDAIGDVVACAEWLVAEGLAAPGRVAVSGRSYGGYVTLMALTLHPEVFAAGVDICGMSDLLTFYRDTEPWIARAAVTKYGDPESDTALLASLSPLRHAERIRVPLLVVHGELDTNVPVGEGRQIVAALEVLQRDVEYLQLDGEGHEYRRVSSRRRLLVTMTGFLARVLSVRSVRWVDGDTVSTDTVAMETVAMETVAMETVAMETVAMDTVSMDGVSTDP
jgi:dipeptidyl aminopeptidase/acylaminoacyl peptidase